MPCDDIHNTPEHTPPAPICSPRSAWAPTPLLGCRKRTWGLQTGARTSPVSNLGGLRQTPHSPGGRRTRLQSVVPGSDGPCRCLTEGEGAGNQLGGADRKFRLLASCGLHSLIPDLSLFTMGPGVQGPRRI